MLKPTHLTWTRFTAFFMSTREMSVDLTDETGAPYRLILDKDQREALGGIMVDPPGAETDSGNGEPLIVRWDKAVTIPREAGDDTIVCCHTLDGQPVALVLDDCLREDLGLLLTDPWNNRSVVFDRTTRSTNYTVATEDADERPAAHPRHHQGRAAASAPPVRQRATRNHPVTTDLNPMPGVRDFTFLATASVLVTVKAANQQAARTAFSKVNGEEFGIDFTTAGGHKLDDLSLEDATPELYRVDGVEPVESCHRQGCDGHLINDRCTDAGCPPNRA
ncbi:hypothetical protein [Streptomyces sp. NBC_01768]|uniref:hypothetical protein n=1 Tax=Streptomyces sp. NBC_01768 TaxID=2975938 RepID=UPI002DD9CDDB|nr:hypothetical protein [Streptomyces sp. NBC_01768]WSC32229.1 hypothetical protein OG902_39200 [Streptomyces sp. NBC_01768]